MAELHVQRKRHHFSWLWALFILIVVGVGVYLYLHYKNPKEYPISAKPTSSVQAVYESAAKTIQS